MQIDPRPATTKNPPENFTGDVWLDPIARPRDEGQRMFVARVRFAPGARTAWHSHARGQTLHITSGVAWVQSRGEDKLVAYPGQTLYCPPGQEHWHGAAPDSFMEHLAMIDNADDPAQSTTWLEHVSDEEYLAGGVSMSWDSAELDRVGTATELDLAARRTDESLSRFTTMWVVRVGEQPLRPLGLRTRQRLVPPCDPAGSRPDPRRRRRARRRARPPRAGRPVAHRDRRRVPRQVRPVRPAHRRHRRRGRRREGDPPAPARLTPPQP